MDFTYTVIRSDRRTLSVEINPDGKVVARAPKALPDHEIEKFVKSKSTLIKKHLSSLSPSRPTYEKDELEKMRERTRALVLPLVEYYSSVMGFAPTSVKITSAKTRFGSCSGKNALCFSLYLCTYSLEAIEYVVVHELCHIKHKNHGKSFHAMVERYLPRQKEYKKLLKRRSEA